MKRKNDLMLFGVILLAALLFWGYSLITRTEGSTVVVTVDGAEFGRYSLLMERETEIVTEYGTNTLVIAGGMATVTEADCPDGLCIGQRDIRYEGESIVCLPHKLVVTIEGGLSSEVDGVVK